MVCEFTGSCSLSEECSARGDYSQPPCATKTSGTQPTAHNSRYVAALRAEIAKLKADGFISVFDDTDSILERLNAEIPHCT